MKFTMTEKKAHQAAIFLQFVCYCAVFITLMMLICIFLGRVEINMTTPTGHYENALLLEKDHATTSRFLYTNIFENRIFLHVKEKVDFITWFCISLMGMVKILPMGFCFLLLGQFFKNIADGKVFIMDNANILLKSGIVVMISFFLVPILNGFIFPLLINSFTGNHLGSSVSPNFTELFFGAILLVMAYVFHYGIYLQNEADCTL